MMLRVQQAHDTCEVALHSSCVKRNKGKVDCQENSSTKVLTCFDDRRSRFDTLRRPKGVQVNLPTARWVFCRSVHFLLDFLCAGGKWPHSVELRGQHGLHGQRAGHVRKSSSSKTTTAITISLHHLAL